MKAARSAQIFPAGFYANSGKRVIDFVAAVLLMAALSPLMLVLAVLVRWRLGTPVLFSQERPGRSERCFRMFKFRSMTDERNSDGALLPDEARLTRFGRFIRTTSLDELPELWNVLRGDMSLVGPRPLLVRYLPYYTEQERLRFAVRPGITGLAQIRGRNIVSWADRLAYDVSYVKTLSLLLDLKILLATPFKVLTSSGVIDIPGNAMLDLDAERSAKPVSTAHENS